MSSATLVKNSFDNYCVFGELIRVFARSVCTINYDINTTVYDHCLTVYNIIRFLQHVWNIKVRTTDWPMVIISFVLEGETSTMMLEPSLHKLQVLMQLEEDDVEIDLSLARLLQLRRRRRRAPRRFWVRLWILRRTDFGHYDRLMHELEVEDHEAFTNFLSVPPETFFESWSRDLHLDCWNRTFGSGNLWNLD